MTAFYDAMARLVLTRVAEMGAEAVLTRETDGGYDPITDTSTHATASWPTQAVLLGLDASDQFKLGTVNHSFAKKAIIPAEGLATVPQAGDRLVDVRGNTWAVGRVDSVAPAGTPVVHTLYLER